jgi:transposase-like protein
MSNEEWVEFKIRLIRRNASISDLARHLGITRQAVSKWRNVGFPAKRVADIEAFLEDES